MLRSLEDGDEGNDDELIVELIDLYLETGAREIKAIETAAANRDQGALSRTAHMLKGSSLTVGAARVGSVCEQLEALDEQSISERADELVRDLEMEFASAREVLTVERQNRSKGAFV